MAEQLADFAYLWQDGSGRYVLIQTEDGSRCLETCLVYDTETKCAIVVEDDDLALQVNAKVLSSGVPMLDHPP